MLKDKFIGNGTYVAGDVVQIDDKRLSKKIIEDGFGVEDAGPVKGTAEQFPPVFDGPTIPPEAVRQAVSQALLAKGTAQEDALEGGATMKEANAAGVAAASAVTIPPAPAIGGMTTATGAGAIGTAGGIK